MKPNEKVAEEALVLIDEALALARETGEHLSDAFLHRLRGAANTAPAEEAFLTAIAIAQQQKARSFELRAAMSMARLWRDQGKRDELASFSLRCTAGSPKGLTRAI